MLSENVPYMICTENESIHRQIGTCQGYEEALEFAKEQAFVRNKLMGVRRIRDEQGLGAPRLVTSSDWVRDRWIEDDVKEVER